MRFTFSYVAVGLRVIPEIPDYPLCHLEGRNGIGKSLAVRLLQLACGDMPYRTTPLAWATLGRQLEACTIRCEDSARERVIEFNLSPQLWPEHPELLTDDLLGQVNIDGQRATFSEARALLNVFRIAGDETLAESLAETLDEHAAALLEYLTVLDLRVDTWQTRLASIGSIAQLADPSTLTSAVAELVETDATHERQEVQLLSSLRRLDELEHLVGLVDELQAVRNELPGFRSRLGRAQRDAGRAERDLQEKEDALRVLIEERKQSKASRRESQRLTSLVKRRQNALSRVELDYKSVLRALALDEMPSPRSLRDLRKKATAELAAAIERRQELDTIGPALELTAALTEPLASAVNTGRGHHIVAILDRSIRADELLDGVSTRRRDLANQPKPGELEEVEKRIRVLQHRLTRLESLETLDEQYRRALSRVQEALAELSAILGRTGEEAERRLQSAQAAVAIARERLVEARMTLQGLQVQSEQFSDDNVARLRAEIAELEVRTGVEGSSGREAAARLALEVERQRAEFDVVTRRRAEAQVSLESLRRAVSAFAAQIESAEEMAWAVPGWSTALAAASVVDMPAELESWISAADFQVVHALRLLADASSRIASAAVRSRDHGFVAQQYLEQLSAGVRARAVGKALESPRVERHQVPAIQDSVRRFEEDHLARTLVTDQLRVELFDGSPSVDLDLRGLAVRWRGPDGAGRRRPLEAFSSGEHAFTYTLAKLESLAARRTAEFALLVLDEFGAFVARDRLTQLLGSVRHRALGYVADQVVVILPLSRDYGAEEVADDDDSSSARRIRQVREHGYFAEPAEVGAAH